ncbi:hypothetical protein [Empedobacter sp. UBA7620]|nr:hypothetical protein [Empedobacter sp. UBA7620]
MYLNPKEKRPASKLESFVKFHHGFQSKCKANGAEGILYSKPACGRIAK